MERVEEWKRESRSSHSKGRVYTRPENSRNADLACLGAGGLRKSCHGDGLLGSAAYTLETRERARKTDRTRMLDRDGAKETKTENGSEREAEKVRTRAS